MSASILRKLHQAQARLQNGDAAAAASLCEDVLRRAPQNAQALWLLGTARLAVGHVSDAVPLLERAVEGMPQHGIALEHLGLGYLALNRFEDAEVALRRAAALAGAPASVHMRLGIAVLNQQRAQEAVAHLQKAVALAPDSALCHLNLGRAIAESGGDEDAREHFERALSLDPGEIDAIFNLGVLALKREDFANAQAWFEKTLAREPRHADALTNLGVALQVQRRLDEALASFRRALAINPTLAAARNNLARTLLLQGNPEAAREEYLAAITAAPALLEAREGVAAACAALGRHREAIAQLRTVVANDAGNARAWTALGDASFQMGELENAQAAATRALEIDAALPAAYALLSQIQLAQRDLRRSIEVLERGFGETGADGLLGMLTHQLRRACDWAAWTQAWREMQSRLDHGADLGSPFWLLHENVTAHEQLAYTRRWAQGRFGASVQQAPARADAGGGRRLRIGYLSSDLQEHALAYLIAGVLEKHDRERFEIFAYSYGPDEDTPMRERLKRACEHFIDVAWEPDDSITRRIREDDIDILIDLKGYTLGARTTILARRPCAIQVNWLGYPGTMGAPFIDYLITDGFIVAPEDESAYSERVLRLKHCWQCNDRSRPLLEPLTREAHGLREHDFVFCCFTQAVKITPEVFECWMRLLASVPRGVLWLADDNAAATQNLRNAAQTHGIAPEKLVFAPRVPFAQHVARYRVADLALDTFPYTSHSTASDALWAGCPIVALCGDTFASRVSGSILTHAGLPELITRDLPAYEALACSLATDPQLLARTRARVAAAKASSLYDAESFARDLERVYLTMAERGAAGD